MQNSKKDIEEFQKVRINRLLIDFLARQGWIETAKKIIEEYNLHEFADVELEVIMEQNKVISDL